MDPHTPKVDPSDPAIDQPAEPPFEEPAPVVPTDRRGVGVIAGAVLLMAALLALVLLVFQNGQRARLHFLWFDAEPSQAALVLASALVAIVLDEAVGLVWRRRRRKLLDLRERV